MEYTTSGAMVSTGAIVEKRQFTWRIENFDWVCQSKELTKSQKVKFQVGTTSGFKTDWCCALQVSPAAEGKDEKCIGIFFKLERVPPGVKEVNAIHKFQIIKGINGDPLYEFTSKLRNYVSDDGTTPDSGWGKRDLITKSPRELELLLVNGSLFVRVEMKVLVPKPVPIIKDDVDFVAVKERFKLKFIKKLQRDLDEHFTNSASNIIAPAKIISKDKKEFVVDGAILSARSPAFKTMFETEMKETETGRIENIEIKDISSKTVAVLLRFIYTGTLRDEWSDINVIVELVHAAKKFDLGDLLEFLDEALGYVCAKETVGKLIKLACAIPLPKAEKELTKYMISNLNTWEEMVAFANEITANNVV